MSDNIPSLARARAHAAAQLEDLSDQPPSPDPVERAAFLEALVKARVAYNKAEEAYAKATCTYTDAELEAILVAGRAAA